MLYCLLTAILVLFIFNPASAQEKIKPRLAIMPFALNGSDDLSHLKEGVRTMLASRIAARAGIVVIGRGEVEKIAANNGPYDTTEVAKNIAADLVMTGSLTALGASVSIDARLVRIDTGDSESFFAVAESQSGIIAAVDQLAVDISENISGLTRKTATISQAPAELQSSAAPDVASEQSLHPDRLFKLPVSVSAPAPVAVPLLKEVVAAESESPVAISPGTPLSASRSQFLDLEVQVMDVGDVFGEGKTQVVIAEKQKITVFHQENNQLVKAGDLPAAPRHVRIIALNLADLNGNGRAEIYISAVSDNNPFSYGVEWDGHKFIKLFDRQQHYLRPIFMPGKGWALYGQQADSTMPARSGIYAANFRDGALFTDKKLPVGESVNLYEFTMGDFTGDGRLETAVQTQQDDLLLYNSEGDLLWQGRGNYGYTSRFIGPSYTGQLSEHKSLQVPTRLVAVDINSDGRQELVAMANPSGMATLIKTVGSFVGGSINVMGWNGVTFNELWSTGEIGSYVASYQVGGVEPRLYIALVSKRSGALFNSLQSFVAGYSLASVGR